MSGDKTFEGSGMVVWHADGKMKYKMFSDETTMKSEIDRMREIHPMRNMLIMAIDWDNKRVLAFIGEKDQELPS